MLDNHLKATCRPIADSKNMLFYKAYRVTVLADRHLRIEKT